MTPVDWQAWNEERERFRELETQGYEQDMATLEAHIKKLLEIAPKDKASWVNLNALDVITLLKRDLERAKIFYGVMS